MHCVVQGEVMRVFLYVKYRLKDSIKPNQIPMILASVIKNNGLEYKKLFFRFESSTYMPVDERQESAHIRRNSVDRLCVSYPSLMSLYRIEPTGGPSILSIVDNYSDEHNQGSYDITYDMVMDILTKMPRNYQFNSCRVVLDGLNYFDDYVSTIGKELAANASNAELPSGSYIAYDRDGVFPRWTFITICIDVTDHKEQIVEIQRFFSGLKLILPDMLFYCEYRFQLDEDETAKYKKISESMLDLVTEASLVCKSFTDVCFLPTDASVRDKMNNLAKIGNLSKALANQGYSCQMNEYHLVVFTKVDGYGNTIQLEIDKTPSTASYGTNILYDGVGFSYNFVLFPSNSSLKQQAHEYLSSVVCFADYFEKKYLARIGSAFPSTPSWPLPHNIVLGVE